MKPTPSKVSSLALAVGFLPVTAFATGSADAGWDLLRSIQTEEVETADDWYVNKVFPTEMKDGIAQFDISGYAVPVTNGGKASEFLLVSDLGFCPFCGDPDHGTALTVLLDAPIDTLEDGQRVTVRGALEPVRDSGTTMTAMLTKARVLID